MEVKRDFSDVVNEYSNDIYRFVLSKVRHRETAEDITQDVFMRALQGWTKYTEMDKLKAWLFKIAHNCVLRQYEYIRRTSAVYSASNYDEAGNIEIDFPDSSSDPENDFLRKEAVDVIIRLVNLLPPEHRVVIKCRYIEDMSLSETAEYTGLPLGTVKSRTHYAIEQIRKNLGINDISEISEKEKNNKTKRRKNIMTCNDAKVYFYIYAIGTLNPEIKKEVDAHLKECDECRELLDTMKELVSKMVFPEDGVFYDYRIEFTQLNLCYSSICPSSIYSVDENGKAVSKYYGTTSTISNILNGANKLMGADGKSYPFEIGNFTSSDGKEYGRFNVSYSEGMEKEKSLHFTHSQLLDDDYGGVYQPDNNPDPDRYFSNCNRGGTIKGKSVAYASLRDNAYDVEVVRGSGIITAGKYRFIYSEQYTQKDETFRMRYSFKLK